ncbi:MAG: GT2 family glycosyltransferase [Arcticibacterium sp.]|jgi:GT2 family glycosyltransferase
MKDVSIILVNYKSADLCLQCIDSIYKFTHGLSFEIILVDNHSGDQSLERVKATFLDVMCIQSGYNAGFSRANNLGAKEATGKYLLILNTDTILVDNVILHSFERLEKDLSISACSVLMLDKTKAPNYVDPNYNVAGNLQYSFIFPNIEVIKSLTKGATESLRNRLGNQKIDFLLGAYIFCRKKDYDLIGGFNEEQFLYGEDMDLSCKLAQLGRLKYYSDLKIIHLEGGSTPSDEKPLTFFSRSPQMQLANLVWVRRWYGPLLFLLIMSNYYLFVPIYFGIRLLKGIINGNVLNELKAPIQFSRQVLRWSSYFFQILFKISAFYKY